MTLEGTLHAALLSDAAVDAAAVDPAELVVRARRVAPLLPGPAIDRAVASVRARVHGLAQLEPLLGDAAITEIMVNGGGGVWIERHGELIRTDLEIDEAATALLIERVLAPLGLHVDRASPVADARLADGSRVHAIVPPLAVDGPCVTIRRFGARRIEIDASCPGRVADLLRWAVAARANLLISGGTGSGKTTLLNALAGAVPTGERIITVEDAAELRLPGEHVIRLEARPANAEGVGEVRVRDLVRSALRMRPDRIVVGEIRGGEAIDMLQAMNTGHDGSLSTCHANAPADALRRVETLVLMGDVALPLAAIREQIVSAVDLVVHLARRPGGRREVVAVDEVERDLAPGGVVVTTPLVEGGRLRRLPTRAVRASGHPPPDPGWLR